MAVYRTVSLQDLSKTRFGSHPFTTRKAVFSMVRAGWLKEHQAKGPKGRAFKVISVTRKGAARAQQLAERYGLRRQATWTGMVKRGELRHDVAVYRAAQEEQRRLAEQGFVVERILIDAEIKRELAQAQKHPHPSMERRRIAGELELPVGDKGRVHIPDAQLQYRDIEGRGGRVSIEVVSEHYSAESIAAKAAAGFSLHSAGGGAKANGRVLAKIAAALGSASGSGSRSGGGGGRGRAGGSIDL